MYMWCSRFDAVSAKPRKMLYATRAASIQAPNFAPHNNTRQMELFGVQELPNSKSISAPGWAYVADTGANSSVSALQPSSRKRAARNLPTSGHNNTAKQDARVLRELAALDKEGNKDVHIPVPVKHRDSAGRGMYASAGPVWGGDGF